jgi:hypothetical protein
MVPPLDPLSVGNGQLYAVQQRKCKIFTKCVNEQEKVRSFIQCRRLTNTTYVRCTDSAVRIAAPLKRHEITKLHYTIGSPGSTVHFIAKITTWKHSSLPTVKCSQILLQLLTVSYAMCALVGICLRLILYFRATFP